MPPRGAPLAELGSFRKRPPRGAPLAELGSFRKNGPPRRPPGRIGFVSQPDPGPRRVRSGIPPVSFTFSEPPQSPIGFVWRRGLGSFGDCVAGLITRFFQRFLLLPPYLSKPSKSHWLRSAPGSRQRVCPDAGFVRGLTYTPHGSCQFFKPPEATVLRHRVTSRKFYKLPKFSKMYTLPFFTIRYSPGRWYDEFGLRMQNLHRPFSRRLAGEEAGPAGDDGRQ